MRRVRIEERPAEPDRLGSEAERCRGTRRSGQPTRKEREGGGGVSGRQRMISLSPPADPASRERSSARGRRARTHETDGRTDGPLRTSLPRRMPPSTQTSTWSNSLGRVCRSSKRTSIGGGELRSEEGRGGRGKGGQVLHSFPPKRSLRRSVGHANDDAQVERCRPAGGDASVRMKERPLPIRGQEGRGRGGSQRPPWFERMTAVAPCSAARATSSTSCTPLTMTGRAVMLLSHLTSSLMAPGRGGGGAHG